MKGLEYMELPGNTVVEIVGDRRVLIENHRGVTRYSLDKICVRVKYGSVLVCGSGMILAQMTCSNLVIHGCIDSITLLKGRTV
jgi:sporulation protein YqfC